MIRRPPRSTRTDTLFPYTTLFRSVVDLVCQEAGTVDVKLVAAVRDRGVPVEAVVEHRAAQAGGHVDRPLAVLRRLRADAADLVGGEDALGVDERPQLGDVDVSALPELRGRGTRCVRTCHAQLQIGSAYCRERVCQYG